MSKRKIEELVPLDGFEFKGVPGGPVSSILLPYLPKEDQRNVGLVNKDMQEIVIRSLPETSKKSMVKMIQESYNKRKITPEEISDDLGPAKMFKFIINQFMDSSLDGVVNGVFEGMFPGDGKLRKRIQNHWSSDNVKLRKEIMFIFKIVHSKNGVFNTNIIKSYGVSYLYKYLPYFYTGGDFDDVEEQDQVNIDKMVEVLSSTVRLIFFIDLGYLIDHELGELIWFSKNVVESQDDTRYGDNFRIPSHCMLAEGALSSSPEIAELVKNNAFRGKIAGIAYGHNMKHISRIRTIITRMQTLLRDSGFAFVKDNIVTNPSPLPRGPETWAAVTQLKLYLKNANRVKDLRESVRYVASFGEYKMEDDPFLLEALLTHPGDEVAALKIVYGFKKEQKELKAKYIF